MAETGSAMAVLSSMITPAVLISACGTLILSTSMRVGRVVDRVRKLTERMEQWTPSEKTDETRLSIIFTHLDMLTRRARLLQRSMVAFYVSLGTFVATSVTIGLISLLSIVNEWIPVVTGMIGACFLFYGCVLLVKEARVALAMVHSEMDFLRQLGRRIADGTDNV